MKSSQSGMHQSMQKWNIDCSAKPLHKREEMAQPRTLKLGGKTRYYTPSAFGGSRTLKSLRNFTIVQSKRSLRALTFGRLFKYFCDKNTQMYAEDRTPLDINTTGVHIQHIGHATELIQLKGLNILTDPAFHDLNPLLYPRKTEPAIPLSRIPIIDVILITHNHRDHCDLKALEVLAKEDPILIVPTGVKKLIEPLGFTKIIEHAWWETTILKSGKENVSITSLPADHPTGRGAFDAYASLACGFIIDGHTYLSGDTALLTSDVVEQIKGLFPDIRINIQAGGPNHIRRNMKRIHHSITESLLTHMRLCPTAQLYINHVNTYELGPDRFNEVRIILDKALSYLNGGKKRPPRFARSDLDKMVKQHSVETILNLIQNQTTVLLIGEKKLTC